MESFVRNRDAEQSYCTYRTALIVANLRACVQEVTTPLSCQEDDVHVFRMCEEVTTSVDDSLHIGEDVCLLEQALDRFCLAQDRLERCALFVGGLEDRVNDRGEEGVSRPHSAANTHGRDVQRG